MTVAHAQHLTRRQRVLRQLGTQFGNPRGPLGALFGRTIFARGNAAFNQWVTQQLDVQPDSHILEVGSGPGVTLHTLAARATAGRVVGLDRSPVMVEQAKRRNLAAMRAGRLSVVQGSAEAAPFDDGSFDLVVAIHVLYFWPDARATLQELRRVLRDGGEVAIGFYLREYAPQAHARRVGAHQRASGSLARIGRNAPAGDGILRDPRCWQRAWRVLRDLTQRRIARNA
jgi:SAM-dependent methyltransferase